MSPACTNRSYHRRKDIVMTRWITFALASALTLVVASASLSPVPLAAEEVALAPLPAQELSLEQAQSVLSAALAAAEEQGTRMDVAVVDAGGNLKAFARMDGAWLGSIDIAISKARTARYFDLPTEALGALSQPGGPLYGIEGSNGGLITFPGGLPLTTSDGTVIGAIGVSGSTVEDDRAVADAGVAALDDATTEALTDLPDFFDTPSGGGGLNGGVVGS
jgi:uncharacterized protein GlcG (DUF336 family)